MQTVNVNLKDRAYDIVVGQNILKSLGRKLKTLDVGQNVVVVTHPIIKKYHGKALSQGLKEHGYTVKFIEVPSGEESKSAEVAFDVIGKIVSYSANKNLTILAFGGGVVGDLAGFIAATYRRGVPYIQVPTTFLAQVDSAIGGKTAIDLPVGKNLIGVFYQPKAVWSEVYALTTLDKRQIKNGLAEAIKYGVICDRSLFQYIETNYKKLLGLDPKALTEVIVSCSRIKAKIVMTDELETKNVRTILNFGHTVGHAIESANKYKNYHHGEAVALGMRAANHIAIKLGLLKKSQAQRINALLSCVGLPEKIKYVTLPQIMHHMLHDKKFKGKKNKFVLATDIGSVKVVESVDNRVIRSAIRGVKQST